MFNSRKTSFLVGDTEIKSPIIGSIPKLKVIELKKL